MTVRINKILKVNMSSRPSGLVEGNYGTYAFITTSSDTNLGSLPLDSGRRFINYTDLEGVIKDWGTNTETYKAAKAFYSRKPTPTNFTVIMKFDIEHPSLIRSTYHVDDNDIYGTTSGKFSVTINSTVISIDKINFFGLTSMVDVAVKLDKLLNDKVPNLVRVFYIGGNFELYSVAYGSSHVLKHATGDVAIALGLDLSKGRVSLGGSKETVTQALNNTKRSGATFVFLSLHKDLRDNTTNTEDSILSVGKWAIQNEVILMNVTNDINTLNIYRKGDVSSILKNAELETVCSMYSSHKELYPCAKVAGLISSTNFNTSDGVKSINLTTVEDMVQEDINKVEFEALKNKNCSVVLKLGKTPNIFIGAKTASGANLDTVHALMWLSRHIEFDMFNFMHNINKVQNKQVGVNMFKSKLAQSLEVCNYNGLSKSGFLPNGKYVSNGFVISSAKLQSKNSTDRIYNGLSFELLGSGVLGDVSVSGNFTS